MSKKVNVYTNIHKQLRKYRSISGLINGYRGSCVFPTLEKLSHVTGHIHIAFTLVMRYLYFMG